MSPYDRFTSRARHIMWLAEQQALRRGDQLINTEHLLLGLIGEGRGLAINVLYNLGASPARIAIELDNRLSREVWAPAATTRCLSTGAWQIVQIAVEEAGNLGHEHVGSEHLLLALLRNEGGISADALSRLGVTYQVAREQILKLSSAGDENASAQPLGRSEFSLHHAEREFFLGLYRSAVDFYKPQIEKKTGIAFGKIAVWDYSRMHEDVLRNEQSRPWFVRFIKRLQGTRPCLDPEVLRAAHEEYARGCCAAYYQSAIYVSFRSAAIHEEQIAAAVVHELAHALWEKLARRPLTWQPKAKLVERYTLLVEGFATYAEQVWFLDLYPLSIRSSIQQAQLDPKGAHYRGFRWVEQLVREYGEGILFRIPQRWRRFGAGQVAITNRTR